MPRRMGRRGRLLARILLNAATLVSLVLCVVTAVLWVRGYFVLDNLYRQAWFDEDGKSYWIQDEMSSGRGGVGMNRIVQSFPPTISSGRTTRQVYEARYGAGTVHRAKPPAYPQFHVGVGDVPVWGGFKRGGFARPDVPGRRLPRTYAWQLVVPYWAVVPPLAALPVTWLVRRHHHRRRVRAGLCPACGYDLRATPDRCPECGTVPTAAPPAG